MIREEKYKNRAKMIADRLNWIENATEQEREVDRFIIWLFSQIEKNATKKIYCFARTGMRDNIWRVKCEAEEFFMQTGKDNEIYVVMQEATEILNKTEKVKAKYNPPEISGRLVTKNASMNISIL